MKKLLLICFVSLFVLATADAQMFKIGLKGGVGFSKLTFDDISGITDGSDVYNLVTGSTTTGYHVGLQTKIKIAMIYIQPELYWNAAGGTVEKIVTSGNAVSETYNVKFNSIDIPVLVGVKLGPIRINAGPVGSIKVSEDNDGLDQLSQDFETLTGSMSFGFQAGLGVDLSKFSIDARYEGSLTKYLGDEVMIGGNPYTLDARPSQWLISLGFWFR